MVSRTPTIPALHHLGDVLVEREPYSGHKAQRGVVTNLNGRGLWVERPLAPAPDELAIRLSPGHTRFTTYHEKFDAVPEEEWTTVERIYSAAARWCKPDWIPEDEEIPDGDELWFALVAALLRPKEHRKVFGDYDWPTSFFELVEAVAEHLDARS